MLKTFSSIKHFFKDMKSLFQTYFTYIMLTIGIIIIGSTSGLIVSSIKFNERAEAEALRISQIKEPIIIEKNTFNYSRAFDDVPDSQYYSSYEVFFKINDKEFTLPIEMGFSSTIDNKLVITSQDLLGDGDVWRNGYTEFDVLVNSKSVGGSLLLENSAIGSSVSKFDLTIKINNNQNNIYNITDINVIRPTNSKLENQIGVYKTISFESPIYGIDYTTLRTLSFTDSFGEILSLTKEEIERERFDRETFNVTMSLDSVLRSNIGLSIEFFFEDETSTLTVVHIKVLRNSRTIGKIGDAIVVNAIQRAYNERTQDISGKDSILENFYGKLTISYKLNNETQNRIVEVKMGKLVNDIDGTENLIDGKGVTWSIGERLFQLNNVSNNKGETRNILLKIVVTNQTLSSLSSTIKASIEIQEELNSNWTIEVKSIEPDVNSWQRKPLALRIETFSAIHIDYPNFYDLKIYNDATQLVEISKEEIQKIVSSSVKTGTITKKMTGIYENGEILVNFGLNSDNSLLTISKLTTKLLKIGELVPDTEKSFSITHRTNVKQETTTIEKTITEANKEKYFRKLSVSYDVNGRTFQTEIEMTKSIDNTKTPSTTKDSLNSLITEGTSISSIFALTKGTQLGRNIISLVEVDNKTSGDSTTLSYEVKITLYDESGQQYDITNVRLITKDENLVDKPIT